MKKLINKIKIAVARMMIPEPDALASIVASAVASFVNNSNQAEKITAFVEKTKPFQDAQVRITRWMADGKLDESEIAELEGELKPVMELLYTKVMENMK